MLHLLDTNICIYWMLGQPARVAQRMRSRHVGELAMSVVTYAELRAGIEMHSSDRGHDDQVLRSLTRLVPVIPFDEADAEAFGRLRAAVRDRRRDALDRMIAAHAIRLDAVLVTNNEADFAGFPQLRVENWTRDDA
jgi:tRNA(fMet)-specific endonuclease VapC